MHFLFFYRGTKIWIVMDSVKCHTGTWFIWAESVKGNIFMLCIIYTLISPLFFCRWLSRFLSRLSKILSTAKIVKGNYPLWLFCLICVMGFFEINKVYSEHLVVWLKGNNIVSHLGVWEKINMGIFLFVLDLFCLIFLVKFCNFWILLCDYL